jgi:predicted regulator of Ras-like GTPase activity (Roadblock/LC7/MglB family)
MMDCLQAVDSLLNRLLDISGSEGASLLASDGRLIGFKSKTGADLSHLQDIYSNFMLTVLNTVTRLNFGDLEEIIILDREKKILIHKVQEKDIYSILFGTSEMNTGLASMRTKEMMPLFEKAV